MKVLYLKNGNDDLGKFDENDDEAIFLGYYISSKALRAFNKKI